MANRYTGRVSLRSGTGCGAPTLRQLQKEGNCCRKALWDPGSGRGARVRVTGVFEENSASACGLRVSLNLLTLGCVFVLIKALCHCPRKKQAGLSASL